MDTTITPTPSSPSRTRAFITNVLYIGLAIGLAMLIQAFVIRPFIVSGSSMDPTIKDKEYLIIDEVSYRFREPARGEVVVFKAPPEPTKYYIKRIIGLPGETVDIRSGVVTIFNTEHPEGLDLDEQYITHTEKDTYHGVIPPGNYFVMGDNRGNSFDSRSWGPLHEKEITGIARLRVFPFSQFGIIDSATYGVSQDQ